MAIGSESSIRRNTQPIAHPKSLGDEMNQGGTTERSSGNTLNAILDQPGAGKRGDPGTSKLKKYLGQ